MSTTSIELQQFLDRERIRNCLIRLARGEDRRDAELIKACCWPDAHKDYGVFSGTFQEYLDWVVPGSDAIILTQHLLGQSLIELKEDTAHVETHVNSYHRVNMGDEERDSIIGGRYLDRLEKRNGEWRIAERTLIYDWFQDYGQSVDWSQGAMGMPFNGEHYTGKIRGDFSETFFAKL
jgi:hypothetical protein